MSDICVCVSVSVVCVCVCAQGDTSAQSDPQLYASALASLCHWYHTHAVHLAAASHPHATAAPPPLVVNTPGWVKGIGLELLTQLINCLGPSHVIQVSMQYALSLLLLCYVM